MNGATDPKQMQGILDRGRLMDRLEMQRESKDTMQTRRQSLATGWSIGPAA
jgi:hypothetical protein